MYFDTNKPDRQFSYAIHKYELFDTINSSHWHDVLRPQ